MAERHTEDHRADPGSVWGIVGGLTRLSQQSEYADKRVEIDQAAGKVLQIAF